MVTDNLDIAVSVTKDRAGILGAARLVLDKVFDANEVNRVVR